MSKKEVKEPVKVLRPVDVDGLIDVINSILDTDIERFKAAGMQYDPKFGGYCAMLTHQEEEIEWSA